jgi:hypothetical protein
MTLSVAIRTVATVAPSNFAPMFARLLIALHSAQSPVIPVRIPPGMASAAACTLAFVIPAPAAPVQSPVATV